MAKFHYKYVIDVKAGRKYVAARGSFTDNLMEAAYYDTLEEAKHYANIYLYKYFKDNTVKFFKIRLYERELVKEVA